MQRRAEKLHAVAILSATRVPTVDPEAPLGLGEWFDAIFTQTTCFQTLNLALQRLHANKEALLPVLERPDIPLHNNLSAHAIRDYVKKRKISATTRSEVGRAARDTFLSLKKTCQKLGLSFWHYLQDRLAPTNLLPPSAYPHPHRHSDPLLSDLLVHG